MIHSILAAVDSSQRAPGVVAFAAEVAKRYGARLVLMRVLAVSQEFPPAAAHASDHFSEAQRQGAAADLERLAAPHAGAIVEPPVIYAGQPWRAIIEKAKELSVDLIVVGSHGYGGLDRILGTTAGKVANHADRSVLVVHEPVAT